jgi:protoporphyrinogen oxidase
MPPTPTLAILGGGPAGLAAGTFARRRGLPFVLFEAAGRLGGNCTTLQNGDFRYDSGAHRLHDRDPEMTAEIQALLGDELHRIDVPSQIWDDGRLIQFPLAPTQLLGRLGPLRFARATSRRSRCSGTVG